MLKKCMEYVYILSFLFLSGCHSYSPIEHNSSSIQEHVKRGDKVSLTTTDGKKIHFVISKIENEYIFGKKGRYVKISDIESIKKQEIDAKKTTILIISIVAGAAAGISLLQNLSTGCVL